MVALLPAPKEEVEVSADLVRAEVCIKIKKIPRPKLVWENDEGISGFLWAKHLVCEPQTRGERILGDIGIHPKTLLLVSDLHIFCDGKKMIYEGGVLRCEE